MSDPRKVAGVFEGRGFHMVGDGFRVNQIFPGSHDLGAAVSPFLMMDYHAPYEYEATDQPRGVGVHPHRGFETVTIAFEGSLAHHDSSGGGGVIHAGDVQWMTAAKGILHKEYHEREWARKGGRMHMMQLWVNLPAAHKMDEPRYQALTADMMGVVDLPDRAGTVRVIAGAFADTTGPASTQTPINLWDVRLHGGGSIELGLRPEDNAALFVLEGDLEANGTIAAEQQLIVFEREGSEIRANSADGARFLVLSGTPIDEPVVSYGPFVMNSRQEIVEAIDDFNAGAFGHLD